MSTNYTNFLAANIRKYGYTVLTYTHICGHNSFVTECKISKVVGGEALSGLGHATTIDNSIEIASRLVADQLSVRTLVTNKQKKIDTYRFFIIENLNTQTTEKDISDLCSNYGEVKNCWIEQFLSQRRAYVCMLFKDAKLVINNHNGKDLDGRTLRIRFTNKREQCIQPPMQHIKITVNES